MAKICVKMALPVNNRGRERDVIFGAQFKTFSVLLNRTEPPLAANVPNIAKEFTTCYKENVNNRF